MASFLDVEAPNGRYEGVTRPYTEQDVLRLRGSLKIEHTLAKVRGWRGARARFVVTGALVVAPLVGGPPAASSPWPGSELMSCCQRAGGMARATTSSARTRAVG